MHAYIQAALTKLESIDFQKLAQASRRYEADLSFQGFVCRVARSFELLRLRIKLPDNSSFSSWSINQVPAL